MPEKTQFFSILYLVIERVLAYKSGTGVSKEAYDVHNSNSTLEADTWTVYVEECILKCYLVFIKIAFFLTGFERRSRAKIDMCFQLLCLS